MQNWPRPPVCVSDDEWMSQNQAAGQLEVSIFRVGLLIAKNDLQPCENESGVAGVTVASVNREVEWRAKATILDKFKRSFGYVLNRR